MKKISTYISSFIIIAFVSVQFILPIQIAKAETPDPMKECGIGALTDFVASGVGGLISDGLGYIGKAAESIPVVGGLIGGILGGTEDPVKDKETRTNTQILSVKNCIQSLTDAAFKVALAKLKKRLLDRITDDTIQWINDGAKGKPRFIDNFDDVLKESANEALGDTARELGLGKLCDEKLSLKLQLNLQKPATKQFREEASCTLDKIVDNVSDFSNDFRNGGWVGYTETLSPNNNRFGLEILAMDNLYSAQTENEQKAQMQASSGNGFKGVEACAVWEVFFEQNDSKAKTSILKDVYSYTNDNDFDLLRDPTKTFDDEELANLFGNSVPGATPTGARCERKEITMPPVLVKGQAEQALQSDKDVLTNADDLSPYISAIFDAAINRLVKSGLEGIGLKQGGASGGSSILTESGTNRQPQTYGTSTRDQNYKNYGQDYQNATDIKAKLRTSITNDTAEVRAQISQLDQTLPGYIESIKNIKDRMQYVQQCEIQKSDNVLSVLNTTIHLPCNSTKTTAESLNSVYESAIDFQKLINSIKTALTTNQNLSNLGESQLIALGTQISSGLEKIKTTRASLQETINKLEEINTKIDQHIKACTTATPTYTCPATF
ncbi:MAG: Uncharacterized protein LiPW41_125 [Parcubacteria group bacterium LiPW_41]|nr:MAG: Uncharacterized protein LiPW41_125 [Parcubacteria group bacterium LiPW_41]